MADHNDPVWRSRVESKLDKLGESLVLLARIDERQATYMQNQQHMGERVGELETRVAEIEKTHHQASPIIGLFKWIAAAVVGALVAILFGKG